MKGYSPKLPLTLDSTDGYRLTRSVKEVVAQNLKMLVLTSPGERVMDPLFGVGLFNFLFELNNGNTKTQLRERIRRQVKKYLPFVTIRNIEFGDDGELDIDRNSLSVVIQYAIPSIGEAGFLSVSV
tara:strand:+ start:228 stop:605 length:378 start_codon:yes stop_codon:yes gene_type:complete